MKRQSTSHLEREVTDKIRTELVENLLGVFAQIDDPDDVYALLQDLCTVREITEMSQRLEVARLLSEKTSYLEIQEQTGASATTISRVSKCLNYGSGGYGTALQIMAREQAAGSGRQPALAEQTKGECE